MNPYFYIVAELSAHLIIGLGQQQTLELAYRSGGENAPLRTVDLCLLKEQAPNPLTEALWNLSRMYDKAPIEAFRAVAEAKTEDHIHHIEQVLNITAAPQGIPDLAPGTILMLDVEDYTYFIGIQGVVLGVRQDGHPDTAADAFHAVGYHVNDLGDLSELMLADHAAHHPEDPEGDDLMSVDDYEERLLRVTAGYVTQAPERPSEYVQVSAAQLGPGRRVFLFGQERVISAIDTASNGNVILYDGERPSGLAVSPLAMIQTRIL